MNLINRIYKLEQDIDSIEERAEKLLEEMRNDPENWDEDAYEDMEQVIGFMQDARHDLYDAEDRYSGIV